jgi:tetratricopeptide (TPR) repeat protein
MLVLLITTSCGKRMMPAEIGNIMNYDSVKFDYFFVEAIKLKVIGNGGDALKFFEQCLKINPESSAAYYQMAQIVIAGGDLKEGKKYLTRAISFEQKNIWYLLMMAGLYYQEGKIDSAVVFYEKAVTYYPEKDDIRLTLANLYSENRKFDMAELIYDDLDRKYGVNPSSSVGSIKNLIWAGRYEEAEKKAKALLKEYPDEILYNGLLA